MSDCADDAIMAELRQIRREMLAEVGGDMDGLFRAIKAEEGEQIRQGMTVVSLPQRRPHDYKPNAA